MLSRPPSLHSMLSDRTDESSGFFGSKATSIRGRLERIVVSDFHGQLILKKRIE